MTSPPPSRSAAPSSDGEPAEAPTADVEERADLVAAVAESALGYDQLRDGQMEAITAVLDGRDVLGIMPTGSGKSAIYQVAGALAGGPVVVVSPLLALQRDQVDALDGRLGGGAALNSDLDRTTHDAVLRSVADGETTFLLMAPEQLDDDRTRERLADMGVALLVVDEAHCIASWGHDVRPAFLRLGAHRAALGDPPVLALTATASPPIRAEIIAELKMADPVVITGGLVRDEIHLSVRDVVDRDAAIEETVRTVDDLAGTGIVYVPTRGAAEALADRLDRDDRPARPYHSKIPTADREAVERRFTEDAPMVVVATTAFGMGIDVPHVRFVVHDQAPATLDSYYQEVGRAARDGDPATAVLIRTVSVASDRSFEGGTTTVERATFDVVTRGLAAEPDQAAQLGDIAEHLSMTTTRMTVVLEHLERAGAVEQVSDGEIRWTDELDPEEATDVAFTTHRRDVDVTRSANQMMVEYLDTPGCRWRFLAAYFGAGEVEPCGRCDRCDAGLDEAEGRAADGLEVGTDLSHTEFGRGTVEQSSGDRVTIRFDDVGLKTLSVAVLREKGLLDEG